MKILLAKEASYVNLEEFFGKNPNVNQKSVYEKGYVVEIDNKIEGCFVLDQLETDIYWLKQLYITQSEAGRLPILLEAILTLAKQQHAKSIYVHSHQPVVDILLEALQFHPQKEKMFEDKYPVSNGSWWAYNVS
ncbi:hypothetical protein [Oceanobacillus rekensis]|uniref:hypothetical protein n=1 Tax=Oceanobacillus rekensis TaxID=937927 RepID=UPI000B44023A|nr:hypothetical protein [Oceanobacillus rekensis]